MEIVELAHAISSPKILIIEDQVKTSSYLQKGLEEQFFRVEVADDGEKGLELALGRDYDLIILDVMLPGRDGWSVMEELRKSGKGTLALFLTARDSLDDRVKGLNIGADAYLMKPFAFSELLAQVRSLLRRLPHKADAPSSSALEIRIADLKIDLLDNSASRSGVRLDLTQKEFALLLLLARCRGEILSRAMISKEVWKIHYDSGTNCVDVHIRRLRSKVDDPWELKLIKTVRGAGYSIDGPSRDGV